MCITLYKNSKSAALTFWNYWTSNHCNPAQKCLFNNIKSNPFASGVRFRHWCVLLPVLFIRYIWIRKAEEGSTMTGCLLSPSGTSNTVFAAAGNQAGVTASINKTNDSVSPETQVRVIRNIATSGDQVPLENDVVTFTSVENKAKRPTSDWKSNDPKRDFPNSTKRSAFKSTDCNPHGYEYWVMSKRVRS